MLNIEIVSIVRIREIANPWLSSPNENPGIVNRGRVDVVVLGVVTREASVVLNRHRARLISVAIGDQVLVENEGSARKISIDDDFEDVVPVSTRIESLEIPEVVVGFIAEVQSIDPIHPSHCDLNIQIVPVNVGPMTVFRITEKIGSVYIALGNHFPVRSITINTRNGISRKLEDFELFVWPGDLVLDLRCRNNRVRE